MAVVRFDNAFHPVGQGLFSSGALFQSHRQTADFVWVYDCGTSSSGTLIDQGITDLRRYTGSRSRINLLVISHFDNDHVNGITKLLSKFKVGILLLPYMRLAQRIYIAFAGGAAVRDPAVAFATNPTDFLAAQDGPGIEQIVFVLPSEGQGPPPPRIDRNPTTPIPNELELSAIPQQDHTSGTTEEGMLPFKGGRQTRVSFLKSGIALQIPHLWEFVPYNDALTTSIPASFESAVSAHKRDLIATNRPDKRESALQELKSLYDTTFGKSSKNRNIISLFLYGGPIYHGWNGLGWLERRPYLRWSILFRRLRFLHHRIPGFAAITPKCSILYSGDGYLDSPGRLDRLVNYLSSVRLAQIGVFQVMHHGAKGTWHKGVAARINAHASIFSSDPSRRNLHHPHKAVWQDFLPYGAVQVNRNGAIFSGWLLRKQP